MDEDQKNLIWNEVLESIRVTVSSAIFTAWFKQTHLHNVNMAGTRFVAEIGCASSFVKSTLETRYYGIIQDTLSKSLNGICDIVFLVKQQPGKANEQMVSTPLFEEKKIDGQAVKEKIKQAGLRESFSFLNFAVSSSNQMAWAAAEAVSKDLGNAYNPLFIWGGVGHGKTHLMQAVGHKALEADLNLKIIFCTGEKFTNDIIEGIRNKNTPAVRQKYRKLDLLMVDDIQFIAGKESVQEEFFHTFNELVSNGKQIIFTSDKPPEEISKLEPRLKSRFEAGLIVDISEPDFELRCAITQIKASERNLNITPEIVHVIAGNLDTARKIEGFLVKLMSETLTKNVPITPDYVQNMMGKATNESMNIKSTPTDLIEAIAKYYTISKRPLLGESRIRTLALPRQILMYMLRTQLGLPLQEVGRVVGGRDHTTVMHAVDKITTLASNDVQIREDIRGIRELL